MTVRFDAITELPSGPRAEAAQQRAVQRRARQQRGAEQRRAQLLESAMALYREQGGAGFHMRALAQRTGYTAGALYAYFDGRDAILAALQDAALVQLGQLVQGALAPRALRASLSRLPPVAAAQLQWQQGCLAWWRALAGQPHLLGLLCQPLAESVATPPMLTRLQTALAPCTEPLAALGLQPPQASQVLQDVLAWAVGVLTLGRPTGEAGEAALLERLQSEWRRFVPDLLTPLAAAPAGDPAAQTPLF